MLTEKSKILSLNHIGLYYSRKQGIFKRRRFWALKNVHLNLYKGETLGVIGRNGVGKSTLLRVLARIIKPNKGEIHIYQKNAIISLISLQAGFVRLLSGRENVILNGLLLGCSREYILNCMDEIIAFSELNEFIDQPVYTYSTGMRARLGFSVAYHVNPDVMLLDEVIGVGDQAFRKKSTNAMKNIISSNKTVVIVSHNAALLREICDRLVWIENGQTLLEGNVDEVMDAYLQTVKK